MLNPNAKQICADKMGRSFFSFGQRAVKLGLISLGAIALIGSVDSAASGAIAAQLQPGAPTVESFLSTNRDRLQGAGFFAEQGLQSFGRGRSEERRVGKECLL